MRKILLIVFSIFLITNIHAQTREIDSLKQLLSKEKTDTGRVLLVRDIILLSNYYRNNPDSSMQLALEGLEISQRIGFKKGEAISLNSMAIIYLRIGNNARALQLFLQALAINEKIRSNEAGRNLNNIALIYRQLGDHRQALNYLIKAQSPLEPLSLDDYIKKRSKDPELQKGDPVVILNIGRSYFDLKIMDSAWFFAQLAYDQALKNNSRRFIGRSLALMGDINSEKNLLTPALEFYRLSIAELKKTEYTNLFSGPYYNMSRLFEKIHQPDSAFYYARESFRISKESKILSSIIEAGEYLAAIYKAKGNADSALFYFEMAKTAKDSVFNLQKISEVQSLMYDEKLRQQEIASAKLKEKEKRKRNLQYAAIALGLVIFIILFLLLSHSVIATQRLIRFLGILALLVVFEFINLVLHPYLGEWTHHSPALMLLIMVGIAALLIPLHQKLEHWITHKLVEKNNKIRLAAAKKTIAKLEGENI